MSTVDSGSEIKDTSPPENENETVSLEELQTWWEIPSIAHFCSLFRTAFDLPDFDIEDLESALLESVKDADNFFLMDLLCRLLRGYYGRDDIQHYNMEVFLKDTIKYNWELLEKRDINPITDKDFKDLPMKKKVEILHCLCDYRLDAADVMDQLKGLDGDNMRVEPLGKDNTGKTYWYFYGNRLYCEQPDPIISEQKSEKKKNSKKKEKKKEKEVKKKEKELKKKEKQKTKAKKSEQNKNETPRRSSRGRILKNAKSLEIQSEEGNAEESSESESESSSESETELNESLIKGSSKKARNNNFPKNQNNVTDTKTRNTRAARGTPKTPKTNQLRSSTPQTNTRSTRRSLRNRQETEDQSNDVEVEKNNKMNQDEESRDVDENSMMSESIADSTKNDDDKDSTVCESKEGSLYGDVDNAEETKKITPRSSAHTSHSSSNEDNGNVDNEAIPTENGDLQMKPAENSNKEEKSDNSEKETEEKNSPKEEVNCQNGDVKENGEQKPKETKPDVVKEERIPLCLRPINPKKKWLLICETFEDWKALADMFKESKIRCERDLYKCIVEDFLPAIPSIMLARENERKRREAEMAPRRLSSRIERKKREQMEQEKILAEAMILEQKARYAEKEEEERKQREEEEKEEKRAREERLKAREERANRLALREQRAQLIAEGKEIPPELMYVANPNNSKYVDDENRPFELDEETVEAMHNVLESIKAHRDAWPFMEAVSIEDAPDYYDIIKKPMDLSIIEQKLTNREYRNKKKFISDFNLMLDNCRVYNGTDNDLSIMAQRLQKAFYRQIQVHMDKLQTGYEADSDFKIGKFIDGGEKKYRPKRAASSKAMDTLHRAMDDEEFESMTRSDSDDSDSRSPRPYVRKDNVRPTKNRLIPELTAQQRLAQSVKDQISMHLNQKKTNKLEWDPEKGSVKFAPYKTKININEDGKKLTYQAAQVVRHNGRTIVYSYGKPPGKTTIRPAIIDDSKKTVLLSSPGSSKDSQTGNFVAQHQQSGGTVRVLSPSQLQGKQFTVQTSQGPRMVRIADSATSAKSPASSPVIQTVNPSSTQSPGQGVTQTVKLSGMLGNKTITVVDGMLCVDGQKLNIPVQGKTRIVYQGAANAASGSPNLKLISGQTAPAGGANVTMTTTGQGQVIQQSSNTVPVAKIAVQAGQGVLGSPQTRVTIPALKTAGQSNMRGVVNIPVINRTGPAIRTAGNNEQTMMKSPQKGRLLPELSPSSGLSGFLPSSVSESVTQPTGVSLQTVNSLLPTTVLNINKYMDDEVCMKPSDNVKPSGNSSVIGGGSPTVLTTNSVANVLQRNQGVQQNTSTVLMNSSSPQKRKATDTPEGSTPAKIINSSSSGFSVLAGHMTETQKANLIKLLQSKKLVVNSNTNQPSTTQTLNVVPSDGEVTNSMALTSAPQGDSAPILQQTKIDSIGLQQQMNSVSTNSANVIQEPNSVSPVKGNLFDNIQTILSSANSSAVSTVSTSLPQEVPLDESPPVLEPEVTGLSPKYKDKMSTFAANLHSISLANKLQALSKPPNSTTSQQVQYVNTSPDHYSRAVVIGQISPSIQNHLNCMQTNQIAANPTLTGFTIPVQGMSGLSSSGDSIVSQGISTNSILNSVQTSNNTALQDAEQCVSSKSQTLLGDAIPTQGETEYSMAEFNQVVTSSVVQGDSAKQIIDVHMNSGQAPATYLPHTSIGNIIIPIFKNQPTSEENQAMAGDH